MSSQDPVGAFGEGRSIERTSEFEADRKVIDRGPGLEQLEKELALLWKGELKWAIARALRYSRQISNRNRASPPLFEEGLLCQGEVDLFFQEARLRTAD